MKKPGAPTKGENCRRHNIRLYDVDRKRIDYIKKITQENMSEMVRSLIKTTYERLGGK